MEAVTLYLVSLFTVITLHEKRQKNIKEAELQGDKMKPSILLKGDGTMVQSLKHHPRRESLSVIIKLGRIQSISACVQ